MVLPMNHLVEIILLWFPANRVCLVELLTARKEILFYVQREYHSRSTKTKIKF